MNNLFIENQLNKKDLLGLKEGDKIKMKEYHFNEAGHQQSQVIEREYTVKSNDKENLGLYYMFNGKLKIDYIKFNTSIRSSGSRIIKSKSYKVIQLYYK
jgi:hypothetical protein